jgi:hypothetical protein
MSRKLKTFVTESGFFELAVAAPSMKAALRDWGIDVNLFQQGLARETDDAAIVAAAEAVPGKVLRRPIGSKAQFGESAALPKVKGAPARSPMHKAKAAAKESVRESERERSTGKRPKPKQCLYRAIRPWICMPSDRRAPLCIRPKCAMV